MFIFKAVAAEPFMSGSILERIFVDIALPWTFMLIYERVK